ncbi:serine hydrolase [Phenylobacterium sp.]|uniref:serine hydrolase n=1 Tax=Phenylobacterium sp. TaxID=1871053 RepID=UPI002E37A43E|nr:serine hydrolase [Phenylobacterium sp.]HEX3363994.1 serine hydrolase [Phenylobacterium sp.]
MSSFRTRNRRRTRARPAILLATATVLLAATFAGGWWAAQRITPQKIAYTKGPAPALRASKAAARPAPAALQATLERIAQGYGEPVGIAVSDVTSGWTASVDGQQTFPQQSVSKLWVALAVMQAVDDKRLSLDQTVTMHAEDRSVFYQPLASRIRGPNGLTITLADLMRHALIESDNAANDMLIRQVGGPGVVARVIADKRLAGLALGGTERDVQTKTAGLEWRPEYGQTWIFKQARAALPDDVRDQALANYLANPPDGATPDGIAAALAALKRGELLSRASTDFMLDLMGEARTGAMRLRAGVQPGWSLAHKTGTGPDWRGASVGINDVGLLTAPDGHTYSVAVMVRETKQPPSARHRLMIGVARAVESYWAASGEPAAPTQQIATSAPLQGGPGL